MFSWIPQRNSSRETTAETAIQQYHNYAVFCSVGLCFIPGTSCHVVVVVVFVILVDLAYYHVPGVTQVSTAFATETTRSSLLTALRAQGYVLVLSSTAICVSPSRCGFCSFRAQNEAQHLSPVDCTINSRGLTDLYPSRGYTNPVTRAIEIPRASLIKHEF